MKRKLLTALALTSVCMMGSGPEAASPSADSLECEDGFPWESTDPLSLLAELKARSSGTFFTVCEQHTAWVKEGDLPELMALLDSEEPCASVMLAASSYISGRSTVGNEAAYLIVGYQRGIYPPELNSNRRPIDKDELRRWWEALTAKRVEVPPNKQLDRR